MSESKSLAFYNARAERYHQRQGFAPARKERMLEVTRDLLVALTAPQSTLLELGAGTGLLTARLLKARHFRAIYVTDGAAAMLALARQTLQPEDTILHFVHLDFTARWSAKFANLGLDAVTSSMAIHHTPDKPQLFRQVCAVLKPGGVFVFADHIAGASAGVQYLIDRERAWVRLEQDAEGNPQRVQEAMRLDEERQKAEGNLCEPVAQYQDYLAASGFQDIDCLWRDYWLAVFVAQKPVGS